MPTSTEVWLSRIQVANEYHETWWRKFKCSQAIQYYEGEQWQGFPYYFKSNYRPYVVNLVFSTIEVKLPSLVFDKPIFTVKPKPYRSSVDLEAEIRKNQLREAALNTFVSDPDNYFQEEIELAILDSFFAFGMIEVGFDASYITNPNAGKPYLKDDGTPIRDAEGKDIVQPDEIPEWEQIYVKRIHPFHFRVGGNDSYNLNRCNWCGYWEYVDLLSLKANKNLKGIDQLPFAGSRTVEFDRTFEYSPEMDKLLSSGDVVKVWHLWDTRKKEFSLLIESLPEPIFTAKYDILPLYPLVFHRRLRGFYPIPPASQWLSPQDDINEANEQIRAHRRRSARKYLFRKNALDSDELDKLMLGPDGTYAEVELDPASVVAPLPLSPLDRSVTDTLIISKDNFNIVSGTASEQRGEADRTTATQAAIINTRSQIRESRPVSIVSKWLSRIARHIIIAQSQLTLPFWIKIQEKDSEDFLSSVGVSSESFTQITGMDIEGLDFEVDINVSSISPLAEQENKNAFLEFLAVINNYPQILLSPVLIREAAERIGFKTNEKIIRDLQNSALLALIGQQQQSALAQRTVEKSTPTDQERIESQLRTQVGLPQ